ncbi:TldD/PmbA family protein [Plectonema cf. radiosum LEGE 06105]|uniref:TldD/PmbA family protein n=1 Tax=Plectonema cf. radiosum LEGE 06105 TaxID=945769 RepID=A0A8J7FIQ7_9CYAN|nr:metallopeptidase TldD-related protein [Plectonema radiosum]MBE9217058.1 TldD/PmbA family protein [Plectonema cf. radiosum LEGE 06105]
MKKKDISALEVSFNQLFESLLDKKKPEEEFTFKLNRERSQFTRFNRGKVRQTGIVADGWIELTLMENQRSSYRVFPVSGNWEFDWQQAYNSLQELRAELPLLPVDTYLVLPSGDDDNREVYSGNLLAEEEVAKTILEAVAELDFTGFYAGGVISQGYADSGGKKYWFSTDTFTLDYSIFTDSGQAVKGFFAGNNWNHQTYIDKIYQAKQQLKLLSRPAKELPRGHYKTYFAPAAVAEFLTMLSWGGISEADIQQGNSALAKLASREKMLSPKFSLRENFKTGLVPRFNEWGEIAPLDLKLIEKGVLLNSLVNSRSAKEYDKSPNGANSSESLRSPQIGLGNLASENILSSLDTGLYVSNLHYLNWSDRPAGRITGMTRYACFWVVNGEIVAPIEDLRFDDTLYSFWGDNLIDFTDKHEFIPEVGTYENRQLGGSMVPGMLVEDFTYTL